MNWLAQVASEMNPLAQFGLLGVVLGYFMYQGYRLPAEIRSLAHRIDGMTKALLMDLISRDGVGPHAREEARKAIAKIQARESMNAGNSE